jgi:hypothetical protein
MDQAFSKRQALAEVHETYSLLGSISFRVSLAFIWSTD